MRKRTKYIYGAIAVFVVFLLLSAGGTYGYKKYISIIREIQDKDAALRVYEAEYKMLKDSIEQKKAERKNIKPAKNLVEVKENLRGFGIEAK